MIAGEHQPPIVHALAHVMNATLGNVGKTVFYTDPIEANPVDQLASSQDLAKDLDAGAVDLLLILGGNPVFNAPVELGMRDRIQKATLRVHLSLYEDETSAVCQWHLPEAHYLETWGDARAFDGTVTIQQPLIQPLYGGRSAYEILQALTDTPETQPYDIVKGYWAGQHTGADFEAWWRRAVHDGVVAGHGAAHQDSRGARRGHLRRTPQKRAAGRQVGSDLPARPDHLRRPLRQQRLAAGTAQADHQADLGQRRYHESRRCAPPGSGDRRHAAS